MSRKNFVSREKMRGKWEFLNLLKNPLLARANFATAAVVISSLA